MSADWFFFAQAVAEALAAIANIPSDPPKNVTPAALVVAKEFEVFGEFNILHGLAKEYGVLPTEILKFPVAYAISALYYQTVQNRYNKALYEK